MSVGTNENIGTFVDETVRTASSSKPPGYGGLMHVAFE